MRKFSLFVLLTLLLALMTSGTVFAQTDTAVFCGDLNADDCALLEGAQTAMQDLSAASFTLFADIQVEEDGENSSISLVGSGAFSGVSMNGGTNTDGVSGLEDSIAGLRDFNGELMLTITLPPEDTGSADMPNSLTLELRLVDGVGYINFDPLQPLINDPSFTGWGGLDLASLIGELLDENPALLEQLGAMGGVDTNTVSDFDMEQIEQYITVERTDDASTDVAAFEFTVDLAGLAEDPQFSDLINEQMDGQGSEGMSETERQEMRDLLENATLLVREEIDTVSGRIDTLSLEFDLDASTMEDGGMVMVTIMIDYDYENVPTISAPDDASVLPYQQLLGMLGGMTGGMSGSNSAGGSLGGTTPVMPEPTATATG